MTDIIAMPPLAKDRHNRHFAPHPDAVAWQPESMNWGKPVAVSTDEGERVLVPLDASLMELEEAVDHRVGLLRLRQVAADGQLLPGPCGYVEIEGHNINADSQFFGLDHALGLCNRLAQANESKDRMMGDVIKALMNTHVQLQAGAVNLLEAANTTIRVANGIERLEREDPVIDVELLSEQVVEAIADRTPTSTEQGPWFIQLLNGVLQGIASTTAPPQTQTHADD